MTIAAMPAATNALERAVLFPQSEASASGSLFDDMLASETQSAGLQTLAAVTDVAPAAAASPSPNMHPHTLARPLVEDAPAQDAKPADAADGSPLPQETQAVSKPAAPPPRTMEGSNVSEPTPPQPDSTEPTEAEAAAETKTGAKPTLRAVPHGKAQELDHEKTDTDSDSKIASDTAKADAAALMPGPVENTSPKIVAPPAHAADPLMAVTLDRNIARPQAPKSDAAKPADESSESDTDSGAPATEKTASAAPAKDAAAPEAALRNAHAAPRDGAKASEAKPEAEAPETAASKPAFENKPAESTPAPQAAHNETQPAPPAHSAPAMPSTLQAAAALAGGNVTPANTPTPDVRGDAPVHLTLRNAAGSSHTAEMDALALRIAAKSAAGDSDFQIRLDPPELGRIDVHLKLDSHGNAEASLSADKPQTLDLLQRDAGALERALKDAGLSLPAGLSFSLKGEGRSNAWRDAQGNGRGRNMEIGAVDGGGANNQAIAAAAARAYGANQQRLDIVV